MARRLPDRADRRRILLRALGGDAPSWRSWQWQAAHRLTDPAAILEVTGMDVTRETRAAMANVAAEYPCAVTPVYLAQAEWCIEDPVMRQILPDPEELLVEDGDLEDPFREDELSPVPGLVHRHRETVLLLMNHYCPVHCRHCFRKRHFAEPGGWLQGAALDTALAYIRDHEEVRDVLITGGEPLMAGDGMLDDLLGRLRAIPRLSCIRIGSRNPVTLPQRITPGLCRILRRHGPIHLNTHFNHAQEFSPLTDAALARLRHAGVVLGNQAVLLRGVNDDFAALSGLMHGLVQRGVRPYYLHHVDPVQGTSHQRVPLRRGMDLSRELRARLPGMMAPVYVADLPGGVGKAPLEELFVSTVSEGRHRVQLPSGGSGEIRDPRA